MSDATNDVWAALRAAEEQLTPEELERRREAGEARRRLVEVAGGTYRAALRNSAGEDEVERR